jgi:hypothetical protein
MSTITPITVDLPAPPPRVLLEKPARDATTRAVLRYFEAERRAATGSAADKLEHADAFDHLVAICSRAVRPYFLLNRHGSLTIEQTPQFDSIEGHRTGHTIRKERSAQTREWIQEWLLAFLAPYRGQSPEQLNAAADADEFRYLGRLCRLRLIGELRAQTAAKNHYPPHVSLDSPIAEDGTTLLDYMGTARQDAPSSLATSNGFEQFLACVSDVFRAVVANSIELQKLDLLDGLLAVLGNAEHLEHVSARRFDDLVTQSIARLRSVSAQSARAYNTSESSAPR